MDKITFDKLLLKTAFCCIASDGRIDEKEISQLKLMYEESELFVNIDFQNEINLLINKINTRGAEFLKYYFGLIEEANLTHEEELLLIDFAIKTIHSDGIDEYSEIKFFKNIRHRLNLKDEDILELHPEVEYWLEQDIINKSYLEKIAIQYLRDAELPQFDLIEIKETK